MTPASVRSLAASLGAAVMLGAALVAGGWVLAAALIGAVAAVGAAADRQFTLLQVLAVLVAAVGLASADAESYVVVLVTGTLASIELAAIADRATVVRPKPPGWSELGTRVAVGAALASTVLVVGGVVSFPVASVGVVGAAAAAALALRVTAR